MLDFKENFFFSRFAVFFFILIVFGYWGVDLNSEEIYIAFTFFFVVVAAFVITRRGILFFFVKAVNRKYARLLGDLLLVVGALNTQSRILDSLATYLPTFIYQIKVYTSYIVTFLGGDLSVFRSMYFSKLNYLRGFCFSGTLLHVSRITKTRASLAFFGKVFNIVL